MRRLHGLGVVAEEKFVDPAPFVAAHYGCGGHGQLGMRVDATDFAGLYERGDHRPVSGTCVMASKENFLSN